jgi:hypothetical protein
MLIGLRSDGICPDCFLKIEASTRPEQSFDQVGASSNKPPTGVFVP